MTLLALQTLDLVSTPSEANIARNIFFGIIAAVMIVAALRMVTTKNIVHAALYLVIVLAGVAGQFILLGAEFAGATQVLVYIGAVVVLFLFGIMLTRAKLGNEERVDHDNRIPAILTAVLLFAVMGFAVVDFGGDTLFEPTREASSGELGAGQIELAEQSTLLVSDAIFSQYIIAFEAISVLLLAALIGAIVIARQE